jgi:hypothetical protein
MTGSRYRLPTAGHTRPLMSATTPSTTTPQEQQPHATLPAFHSVRRPAPASRPSGRYTVGLPPEP